MVQFRKTFIFLRDVNDFMHLWGHFEVTLKVVWAYEADFEVTLGHSGVTLGSLLDTFGSLFGAFWDHLRVTLGVTFGYFGVTSV